MHKFSLFMFIQVLSYSWKIIPYHYLILLLNLFFDFSADTSLDYTITESKYQL